MTNISTIRRITKHGSRHILLAACGDTNWRIENSDSKDCGKAIGIGYGAEGNIEFRFNENEKYEYVVTLTEAELRRALELLK